MTAELTDKIGRHLAKISSLIIGAIVLLGVQTVSAQLTLLQPDPGVPATYVGTSSFSADGLGQVEIGGFIRAEVPPGSAVEQAFLYGTYNTTASPDISRRTILFEGVEVELTTISSVTGTVVLSTARADVTSIVATKVGSGNGITLFSVGNDPDQLDGLALVVIYSNPSLPETTIAVLDGSASQDGDTASFNFFEPLDKTVPGFFATLSLASGFSFQSADGSACNVGSGNTSFDQFSIVEVNGALLTNCAGNYDDGVGENDALITVGGIGDSTNNPSPPNAPLEDDELYDLDPFLSQGDTGIQIMTSNPSQDDNLFLAIIAISADAQVTTEICDDGIDNDGDGLIDSDDPDCEPLVRPEICDDGIDNDGDGLIDIEDPDCELQVLVPGVVGLPLPDAESLIIAEGLTVGTVTTQSSSTVPAGNVISQNPDAGTTVAPGAPVDLVFSSGPARKSRLTVDDSSVSENAGPGVFTVSLDPPGTETVTVRAAGQVLSATPGVDHYGFFKVLSFAPGETSKEIPVIILNDNIEEDDEQVGIRIYSPTNATIDNSRAVLTIVDDDKAKSALSVNDVTVKENAGYGQFTITLNPPDLTRTVSLVAVGSTISGTPGEDYYGFRRPVNFAPGETQKTVNVRILDDSLAEEDEVLGVRLIRVTNAETLDDFGEMTIVDDDKQPNP